MGIRQGPQQFHPWTTQMARVESDQVELSARVSMAEFQEFTGNFPMYGASTWLIRTTLAEFNKKCREQPQMIELIRQWIEEAALSARTGVSE